MPDRPLQEPGDSLHFGFIHLHTRLAAYCTGMGLRCISCLS
jgi:hypothetical protein